MRTTVRKNIHIFAYWCQMLHTWLELDGTCDATGFATVLLGWSWARRRLCTVRKARTDGDTCSDGIVAL